MEDRREKKTVEDTDSLNLITSRDFTLGKSFVEKKK